MCQRLLLLQAKIADVLVVLHLGKLSKLKSRFQLRHPQHHHEEHPFWLQGGAGRQSSRSVPGYFRSSDFLPVIALGFVRGLVNRASAKCALRHGGSYRIEKIPLSCSQWRVRIKLYEGRSCSRTYLVADVTKFSLRYPVRIAGGVGPRVF